VPAATVASTAAATRSGCRQGVRPIAEESRRQAPVQALGIHEHLHVAVEVVDGALPGAEGRHESHVVGDVPLERDARLPRGGGDRVEDFAPEAGMELEKVVAGRFLLAHHPHRRGDVRHAVAVERRPARVEARAEHAAVGERRAQLQVPGMAEHAADRGHAVRGVEQQHVLRILPHLRPGHVGVHLGEAGDQRASGSVHDDRARGSLEAAAGRDAGDAPVLHENIGGWQHASLAHGDDLRVAEEHGRRDVRHGAGGEQPGKCKGGDADHRRLLRRRSILRRPAAQGNRSLPATADSGRSTPRPWLRQRRGRPAGRP
jgi:hypothetical protein